MSSLTILAVQLPRRARVQRISIRPARVAWARRCAFGAPASSFVASVTIAHDRSRGLFSLSPVHCPTGGRAVAQAETLTDTVALEDAAAFYEEHGWFATGTVL